MKMRMASSNQNVDYVTVKLHVYLCFINTGYMEHIRAIGQIE